MDKFIRQCNLFLEAIDLPKEAEDTKTGYVLKIMAYYNMCQNTLMRAFPDWKNHSETRKECLRYQKAILDMMDEAIELGIFEDADMVILLDNYKRMEELDQ